LNRKVGQLIRKKGGAPSTKSEAFIKALHLNGQISKS